MKIVRAVGREAAGMLRSFRYDLASRRSAGPATGPEVEVGPVDGYEHPDYDELDRPRRRALATTGVAVLVLGGAAGTYFAVVAGLDALTDDGLAASRNALPTVVTTGAAGEDAFGRVAGAAPTEEPPTGPMPQTTPVAEVVPEPEGAPRPPAPDPSCDCPPPPVPTPTDPEPEPEPTSSSPSPSPSPTPSASSTGTPSASPSPSRAEEDPGDDSDSPRGDRRHRDRRP